MANQIKYQVDFNVKGNSLNQLKSSLQSLKKINLNDIMKINNSDMETARSTLHSIQQDAGKVETALNKAFNTKLNSLNIATFNKELASSNLTIGQVQQSFSRAGASGQATFNSLTNQILNTNLKLRQSNKLLDSMATSMANTIKWGITSSIFNGITRSIQQAYYYAKDLDRSLTNIRVVTGDSAEQMTQFATQANNAAKDLGRSTLDYTKAALSFYQQGLDQQQVAARTEATLKAENITGIGSEMADYLTSVWNGFNVGAQDAELYVDKLAAVADTTASDMGQLATAMSKVASAANSIGVDVDQLNGQIATVIATTRQAPETVGAAFKTIYARINDIKAGTEDAEVSLGTYSGKMAQLGFNVLDATGHLRDTGEVIEEIGGNWQNLTKQQQINLAQTMAGQRQYNNLIALFDNWDKYLQSVNTSMNAQGTLNEKNDIYLESLGAHLQELGTQAQRTYDILFDTETAKGFIDLLDGALTKFNDFIGMFGSGAEALTNLGLVAANVFSKQIAGAIDKTISTVQTKITNIQNIKGLNQDLNKLNNLPRGESDTYSEQALINGQRQALEIKKQILQVSNSLTQSEYQELESLKNKIQEERTLVDTIKNRKAIAEQVLGIGDATDAQILARIQNQEKSLNQKRQQLTYMDDIIQKASQNEEGAQGVYRITEQEEQKLREILGTKADIAQYDEVIQKLRYGQVLSQEDIALLTKDISKAIADQSAQIITQKQLKQAILAVQRGEYDSIQAALEADRQRTAEIQKQAQRRQFMNSLVSKGTAIIQATQAAMAGIQQATNEMATGAERVNGYWSATTSALSGVANFLMPGSGLLVQGVSSIIQTLFKGTDIYKSWEESLKSVEQRLGDLKKQQEQAMKISTDYTADKTKIQNISEEFEELSAKAGKYNQTLSSMTEEQQARYHALVKDIIAINPDLVTGYTSQGEAIIANNDAIQGTLDLLDAQYQKQMAIVYAKENVANAEQIVKEKANASSQASTTELRGRVNYSDDIIKAQQEEAKKAVDLVQRSKTNTISGAEGIPIEQTFITLYGNLYDSLEKLQGTSYEGLFNAFNNYIEEYKKVVENQDSSIEEIQQARNTLYNHLLDLKTNNLDQIDFANIIDDSLLFFRRPNSITSGTAENIHEYFDQFLNSVDQLERGLTESQDAIKNARAEAVSKAQTTSSELESALMTYKNYLFGALRYDPEYNSQFAIIRNQWGKQFTPEIQTLLESVMQDWIKATIDSDYEKYLQEQDMTAAVVRDFNTFMTESFRKIDPNDLISVNDQIADLLEKSVSGEIDAKEYEAKINEILQNFLKTDSFQKIFEEDTSENHQNSINLLQALLGININSLSQAGDQIVAQIDSQYNKMVSNISSHASNQAIKDAISGLLDESNYSKQELSALSAEIEKDGVVFTSVSQYLKYIEDFFEKGADVAEENASNLANGFDKVNKIIGKIQEGKDISYKDKLNLKQYLGLSDEEVQDTEAILNKFKQQISNLTGLQRYEGLQKIFTDFETLKQYKDDFKLDKEQQASLWQDIFDSELEALGMQQEQLLQWAQNRGMILDSVKSEELKPEDWENIINTKKVVDDINAVKDLADDFVDENNKLKEGIDTSSQSFIQLQTKIEELTGQQWSADSIISILQQIAQWTDNGSQSAQEYLEWLKELFNFKGSTPVQTPAADQYQQGKQNLSTLQSASDALSNKSSLSDDQAQAIAQLESQNQELADIAAQAGRYSQQYLNTLNETINSQRILNEQKREQARIDTQEQLEALKAQKKQLEDQLVTEEEYKRAKNTLHTVDSHTSEGVIKGAKEDISSYEAQTEQRQKLSALDSQILEKETKLVQLSQQDVSALKDKYQTLKELQEGLSKKEISKDEYQLIRPEVLQKNLKALNKNKKELDAYTNELLKNNKAFEGNVQAAEDYAISQWQIEKTIKSLKSNFKTYRKAIQDAADSSEEAKLINSDYQEAIKQLGSSMRDIIGINFSDKFMENADNLNLMQSYLDGDTEALERLRAAALQDIIISVSTDQNDLTEIQSQIMNLILQDWDQIVIGANLDDTQFVAGLNRMLANGQMTEEQVNSILSQIGYHATVKTVDTTVMMKVPVLEWASQVGDNTITQNTSVKSVVTPVSVSAPQLESVDSNTGGGGHGAGYTPPSSGGSGGGSCFVAGTLVSTDEGFKNIEDIQIGDIVLSYNLKTLQNEYSEVLETMIHDTTENIYSIHIEDDIIKSTGIHKFFIVRNKKMNWISAQNLQIGDSVYFADGTLHKIQQIDIEEKSLTVYNFEVSGNHNYYVGKNQILVHNKGKGGCFIAGTLVITKDGFKNIENIQKGDIVLSFNEANNKNEYSEVLETMVHIVHENIYTLHIGNETLVVTGIHRFLITRNNIRSWIHAQDLQVGDFVQYADGTLHEIEQIDIKFDLRTVYNFEVSDNHNYYVGHNGILAHNKGKGGGGKGKKQEKDTSKKDKEEELKDEIDLYHDVDRELKGIDRQLSRLQKQQKKLEGPALQENLNKQLALLEKQVQKLKEKQQIQLKDLEIRRQELKGLGLVFDEYGNITNYMAKCAEWQSIINDLVRQYNDLIEKYNKTTKKSQKEKLEKRIDAVKEKLDAAKKEWEQFKDSVQEYEDLQDSSADNQDSILDINDQIDEIKNGTEQAKDAVQDAINEVEEKWDELIEAFRRPIVFRLDMGQAEREWNQFRRQVLEHTDLMADPNFKSILADDRRSIRDIGSYFKIGEGIGTLEGLTKQLWATRDEIEAIKKSGSSAVYGPDKDRALEDLSSDLSQLMGQLEDIQSLIDEVDESYFDTIDDAQEHFNKQIDDYAYVRDLIDHDIDLMKILYGDNNYDAMDKYYTTLEQNNNKNLESLRKQRDFWKQQWDDAVARGDTNAAEKFEQNYKNAINNLNSLISESIDNLKNKYENAINKIFDALNNKVSGGKGLDYLSLEWELMTKNTDEYLDTVNSAFAIQQTQRKYQKAIDETKNIKNQQALKKVMEEQLDILKNKERLTQYDVDRAQKLLEIEQARIALEDAQSAKTKLRLKRNAQGNYSYEYIADNSAVSDAQDKLATAQNALYNFDKDRYKSNLNDMLSAWNDFQSKYKEIILDISLDEEERIAKLALLREEYGEYINGKTEQNLAIRNNLMDSAFREIASIYQSDVNNYQQMADNEKAIFMEELVPMWNSGIQQMSEKIVGEGGFLPTCDQAFKDITESTKRYKEELDNMADAAGIDLTNVKLGVDDLAKSFEVLIEDNDKLISRMKDEMSAVSQLRAEAEQLIRTYQGVYDSAKQATTAIYEYLRAEQERAAYETQQQAAAAAAAESSTGSSSSSEGSSSSESTQDIDSQIAQAQKDLKDLYDLLNQQDFTIVQTDYKIMTKEQAEAAKIEAQKAVEAFESRQNNIRTQIAEKEKLIAELQAKKSQSSLATGGYTGDWNSNEGQLAILHKKELVLNESDTKNFLNGVTILREISSNLNGNMFSMLNGLSAFKGFDSHSDGAFEQNVHIDASFPNVNSKREIEEAFNELVNMAAQRAMRR